MDQTRTSEARYGAPDISGAAPLATRGEPRGFVARAREAVIDWVKTAAITLGTMYVIGWFVMTVGVAWMNRVGNGGARFENTMQRHQIAEAMRPYALAPDPRITLDEATRAFAALQPPSRGGNGYVMKQGGVGPALPWKGLVMAPELFPTARASSYEGPGPTVIEATKSGFSAKEREVLRSIGTAPQWRVWDLLARAPSVDIVGARFETPFAAEAHVYYMPILKFGATKEYAYAAVTRAAWHISEGRSDSAEAILRAIVSNGFALRDNATFAIDQLIGNSIIGIGRDALIRFYALTGDPRGPAIEAEVARASARPIPAEIHTNVRDYKLRVVAIEEAIRARSLGRGIQMEMLSQRAQATCGDARELVLGQRASTRDVFDRARQELARYPAERATIDLIQRSMEYPEIGWVDSREPAIKGLEFLGRIYFNPRLASCTLTGMYARGSYYF